MALAGTGTEPAPPPWGQCSDDFNRANQPLENSSDWEIISGSVAVVSNQAQATGFTAGWAGARCTEETATDDQFAELVVTHEGDGSGQRNVYVAVRMDDGTLGSGGGDLEAYIFAYRFDTGQWRLRKKDGTSYETLASVFQAAPTTPFTIRLEAEGNEIRAFVDGVPTLSTTDSSFSGASHRHVGFVTCCNDSNPAVDDFVGGILGEPPP